VISAVLVTILFVVSLLDLRDVSAMEDDSLAAAAAELRGPGYGRSLRDTQEVVVQAINSSDQDKR